ncbi:MAG: hypothetical protein GXO48_03415, partial [Chlorobi bacterium]|nr:hypothetical protein [Chlorobiota bacterium]
YVQKWTGSELCNSIIYDNGTRVGIGTASPQAKFHIKSSGSIDAFLIDSSGLTDPLFIVSRFGNVGINVSNPSQLLVARRDSNSAVGAYIINQSSGSLARAIVAVQGDTGQGSFFITSSNYSMGSVAANSVVVAAERTADNLFLTARNKSFGKGRIYMLPRQGTKWPPTVTVDSGVVCVNCVPGSDDHGLLISVDTFLNNPIAWSGFKGVAMFRHMPVDGNPNNLSLQFVNVGRSSNGNYSYILHLGDPDGGYGVVPDAFEIWEYPDSIGAGTCCRQRFRIMSSRGLENPPPVTIDPLGNVSIGGAYTNAPFRLTVDSGAIAHRVRAVGPSTGLTIPYGLMYVNQSDEFPNYHEEYIITFGNAGDDNSSIFIGPNSATGGVGRVELNAAKIELVGGGNVGINVPNPTNILTVRQGSPTDPIADSWTVYSTRETKSEVIGVVGQEDMSKYLKHFREMPVYRWRRTEGEQVRLSPMADDVGVPGEIRAYDGEGNVQGIDLYGYIGFLHVVMKGMYERMIELEKRVAELEKQQNQ